MSKVFNELLELFLYLIGKLAARHLLPEDSGLKVTLFCLLFHALLPETVLNNIGIEDVGTYVERIMVLQVVPPRKPCVQFEDLAGKEHAYRLSADKTGSYDPRFDI